MRSDRKWKLLLTWLVAFLMLTGLALFAGCDHESDDIPTGAPITVELLIEQGWSEYAAGNFEDASLTFNRVANIQADNLEAYLGMGYSFAQLNQIGRALQNLNNVIGLGEVLVEAGTVSDNYATTLDAEAYAGMAAAYLADRQFDNAVTNADSAIQLKSDFLHRYIPEFDLSQLKLIKADAFFGEGEYAMCMNLVDEITGNTFITGSDQIKFSTDTVEVTMLANTPVDGIAELELNNYNLIYPIPGSLTALQIGLLDTLDILTDLNGNFDNWTDGDPDNWTVVNEDGVFREISEVGSNTGHGQGGSGSCNFYNFRDTTMTDEYLSIYQDFLPADTQFVRVELNVSYYVQGALLIFKDGDQVGTISDIGNYVVNFYPGSGGRLTLSAADSSEFTVDYVSCFNFNQGFTQEILDYEATGNVVRFQANPKPQYRDLYSIRYMYAEDFGMFLIELREKIDEL